MSAQSQRGACTSLMYRSFLQRQPKGRMKRSQAKCEGSYIYRVQKNTLVIHAETCVSIIDLELNKRTNYVLTHLWNIQNKQIICMVPEVRVVLTLRAVSICRESRQ